MHNNYKLTNIRMPMNIWSKVATILITFLLAMCFTPKSSAQSQTVVYLEPSALTLAPKETSVIQIRIDNAEGLYGFEVHLDFDPNLIQIIDNDQDTSEVQLIHGDVFDVNESFLVSNQVDNEQGSLIYAITQLAPSEPVNGDFILLSVPVQATSLGASDLTLSLVILASEDGNALPFESHDGKITITEEGTETTDASNTPNTSAQNTSEGKNGTQTWVIGISVVGLGLILFFTLRKYFPKS